MKPDGGSEASLPGADPPKEKEQKEAPFLPHPAEASVTTHSPLSINVAEAAASPEEGSLRLLSSLLASTATSDVYDAYGDIYCRIAQVSWPWLHVGGRSSAFYGRAVTVSCPAPDNSPVYQLLSSPPRTQPLVDYAGHVLVVQGPPSSSSSSSQVPDVVVALLGDQLAAKVVQQQWAGVVVDGCVRDVAQLRNMPDLALVARGSTPRKSNRQGRGLIQVPIRVGGAECRPGDWVVVDADGVLFLSPEALLEEKDPTTESSSSARTTPAAAST